MDYVALQYNGEPNKPSWRGKLPPITPKGGLAPGENVEITAQLMRYLHREDSYQSRYDFATFLAEVYNRKGLVKRWSVLSDPAEFLAMPEPVAPEPLQSGEKDTAPEDVGANEDLKTGGGIFNGLLKKAKEETD